MAAWLATLPPTMTTTMRSICRLRLSDAAAPSCTAAQRVCFLVREIPAAFTQAEILPDASYGTRFRPQVEQWRLQLTALTKESALEPYAHAVHRKLMWLDSSEHDRRLSIENGDVLHVLHPLIPWVVLYMVLNGGKAGGQAVQHGFPELRFDRITLDTPDGRWRRRAASG